MDTALVTCECGGSLITVVSRKNHLRRAVWIVTIKSFFLMSTEGCVSCLDTALFLQCFPVSHALTSALNPDSQGSVTAATVCPGCRHTAVGLLGGEFQRLLCLGSLPSGT